MKLLQFGNEPDRILAARVARYSERKKALEVRQAKLKTHLAAEVTRPGSLAAVACLGFLLARGKSKEASAIHDELTALSNRVSAAAALGAEKGAETGAEKGAERGAEHGAAKASVDAESGASALDYILTMATTTLTKFAVSIAMEQLNTFRSGHSEQSQNSPAQSPTNGEASSSA